MVREGLISLLTLGERACWRWAYPAYYRSSLRAPPPCEAVETALLAVGDNLAMIVPGSDVMQLTQM